MNEYKPDGLISHEDMMKRLDEIEKKYKQSWRWKFIDRFFPNGFDGYNPSFFITKPWEFPKSCYRHVRWAWQRVFSYDERIIWSIDHHLAKMIPIWIKQLKKDHQGIPVSVFEKSDWDEKILEYIDGAEERARIKWNNILDQIAEGFDSYVKIDKECLYPGKQNYDELNRKYETGFELFKIYFEDLWD